MDVTSRRLTLHLVAGALLGSVYSFTNWFIDQRTAHGGVVSSLAPAHDFVDIVLPVFIGMLLGVCGHYIRVHKRVVEVEKRRADELRQRLAHVERDQAVWVLAAAVLHEVKNPLHALGLLIDDVATAQDDAEREAFLEKARAHVQRIADRLAELRGLSGGGLPEIAPTPLGDLAREVASEIAPIARRDGIELTVRADGDTVAACDASYVRVILENLVENSIDAMKAHRARGEVTIELGGVRSHVRVRVRDDGPGLPAAQREGLFRPLSSRKKGGMGLGLSISRKLARAMDGDVRYDGDERPAFVLELPRERSAGPP